MAVDDEPEALNLLKSLLEAKGCEVQVIADSRIAADRLQKEKVDGLFLDVCMPHLDGFELTHLTRATKLNRTVPIVMLAALNDAQTMRKGFDVGINFFLGKPITRERAYNLLGATLGLMLRERQRYIRLPYRTTVECTWGPHGQGHFKSSSMDISQEGMSLSPSGGLEVGQDATLRFSLPNTADPLNVKAQVVRVVPPNSIGMTFLTLAAGDKEAILRYIAARTEEG